jgi:rsbT co-antagonist protein RsbR
MTMNDSSNDASNDASNDLAALRGQVADLETQLADIERFFETVFEKNPNGIALALPDGKVRLNATGAMIAGASTSAAVLEDWQGAAGIFLPDKRTPYPPEQLALARAMRGERIANDLTWLRMPPALEGVWIEATAKPLAGGSALAIFRDVTAERDLDQKLAAKNRELAEREAQNRDLVERLRLTLDALSTPVIEMADGVLALPIIGVVDTQRAAAISERVLTEVARSRTRFVVIDLTGVTVVDTSTADRILKLARALSLLGVRCIVSGIQPPVAQTLVAIGVELDALVTERDLQHALEYCERARGDS